MGFYYDKSSDGDRMISKFDKINKRNNEVIDENHPNFDPSMLSITEQIKYFDRKNEKEKEREAKLKVEMQAKINKPRTVTLKNK
jgi:lipopolysaccharide export LptBFGC system permease protein LptF